jgi:hypothetical protein
MLHICNCLPFAQKLMHGRHFVRRHPFLGCDASWPLFVPLVVKSDSSKAHISAQLQFQWTEQTKVNLFLFKQWPRWEAKHINHKKIYSTEKNSNVWISYTSWWNICWILNFKFLAAEERQRLFIVWGIQLCLNRQRRMPMYIQ